MAKLLILRKLDKISSKPYCYVNYKAVLEEFLVIKSQELRDAASQIRFLLANRFPITFTKHPRKEMIDDGFDIPDVIHMFKGCHVTGADLEGDCWRFRAQGTSVDGIPAMVVVVIKEDLRGLTVITVWSLKKR